MITEKPLLVIAAPPGEDSDAKLAKFWLTFRSTELCVPVCPALEFAGVTRALPLENGARPPGTATAWRQRAEIVANCDALFVLAGSRLHILPEVRTARQTFVPIFLQDIKSLDKHDGGYLELVHFLRKTLETRNPPELVK